MVGRTSHLDGNMIDVSGGSKGKGRIKSVVKRPAALESAAKAGKEISKPSVKEDSSLVPVPSKREARVLKKTEKKKNLHDRESVRPPTHEETDET